MWVHAVFGSLPFSEMFTLYRSVIHFSPLPKNQLVQIPYFVLACYFFNFEGNYMYFEFPLLHL